MIGNLVVDALGVRVGIVCDGLDDDSRAAVEAAWQDARTDAAATGGADIEVVAGAGGSIRALLSSLSQRVTLAAIEAQRGRLWMLHAAGIALPDGRVVALVGPSGRGKTTASRVVGEAYGYVSDETVAIDAEGRVHAYRKPLSIIEAGAADKAQRSPSALGLGSLPDRELRLAGIVLLDRREGVSGAVVSDVDLGDALEELVAQSSYLTNLPAPLRTIAAHVASVGGVRRASYTEAAALAGVIPDIAAVSPSLPLSPSQVSGWASPGRGRVSAGSGGRLFRRVLPLDELPLADPDRIALLHVDAGHAGHAGTVRVLAGIAPALWRAADGVDLESLVQAAVSTFEVPEGTDAASAVEAAADELVDAGVLQPAAAADPLWRIHDDVAWTGESARVVVLALANPAASPLALEGSAALVWMALAAGPGCSDTIVARVADAAEVDGDAIRPDVESFLGTLRDQDLVLHG